MASAQTVNKRRTCSICLEAFRGRQPKILSCFHTFCSPCLIQLVDREDRQKVSSSTQGYGVTGEKDLPVTLTCPTCRTCVPVPPGGVSQLQTNFYLEEEATPDPSPLLCDLCEEGQKAEFQCGSCVNYFCSRCRRFHDKLCKSPAASVITDSTGSAGTQSVGKESQDLAQRMEDVLKKVAEEEKKLALERRATEQDIYERYNSLLRHAAEARDSSLMSLRDVTQAVSDSLMNTASLAREVLTKAKDKTSAINGRDTKDEVFTESMRRRFEELLKKADEEALLTYTITDSNTHVLLQSLSKFMSTVVARSSADSDSTDHGAADGDQLSGSCQQTETSGYQNADLPDSINAKFVEMTTQLKDLSARFSQNEKATAGLQSQNSQLCKDLVAVQEKNTKLTDDCTALRKEVTSLRDEVTSQRREHLSIRDKHTLLLQENEIISSDLNRVKTVQNQIQSSHAQFQTECDKIHTDLRQLQTDHGQVETAIKHLQSDHDQVLTKQTTMQGDVDQLQVDRNKLKTEVQTLKTDVGQLNDLCEKDKTAIAGLKTRLNKINVHVAFHAELNFTLTVSRPQTIVCDNVMTNIGGGYSGLTGIFTAPVSGTYCFMASSSPDIDDSSKLAALLIVMEEKNIGYLDAWGRGVSTCHRVVHMQAGQKVWLKSFHHGNSFYHGTRGERRFACERETSFTGMLLQPDL